jgi:hypothetical protein
MIETMPFMARLLAPATSVAVVIVVIVLLIWINGGSAGNKQSPAAVAPASHGGPAAVTPTRSHSPKPAVTPSTASGSPAASNGTATPHRSMPATTATAPVTVLNNSTRTGLAHAVAAEVHAKGWPISVIGNLQGLVAESTVYYAPGAAAAARHLAHEFGSIRRVETNRAGGIHGTALTLVVTRDWVL